MRWLILFVVVIVAASCLSTQAAIIIDPNNVGATDVDGLTNPVPDPLLDDLWVGLTGRGEVLINDSSTVVGGLVLLGEFPGSVGIVTVDGAGSSITADEILVGIEGEGTLAITNGGAVENNDGWVELGVVSGGVGTLVVDGTDSTLVSEVLMSGGSVTASNGGAIFIEWDFSADDVTVIGAGSMLTIDSSLTVPGSLGISDGGVVNVGISTRAGYAAEGLIEFNQGTLVTKTLFAAPKQLIGTGTTNTNGLISDVDLVFDATRGPIQTITLDDDPNQNININLNADGSGYLGAGYDSFGSMRVADGVSVESKRGYIGYLSGSSGVVEIDGFGSSWVISDHLIIGVGVGGLEGAHGVLKIANGGTVSSPYAALGDSSDSSGTAIVDGLGSSWTGRRFYIRRGSLSVVDGGLVSADRFGISEDADGNSLVNMATGGMLALKGEADGSITEFLDLVGGTDAIRYWDTSLPGWAHITAGTQGVDYSLEYLTSGDLTGYTKLTVYTPIPEPMTWMLLVAFTLAMMCHYRLVRC